MEIRLMLLMMLGCAPRVPPDGAGIQGHGSPCAESLDDIVAAGWRQEDPTVSRKTFEQAAEVCGDPYARHVLHCHAARADTIAGDPRRAIERLDQLSPASATAQWRSDLERARAMKALGQPETARQILEAAFEASAQQGPPELRVELAHLRALAADQSEDRIAWLRLALGAAADADTSGQNIRNWKGALNRALATTLYEDRAFDESLEHWRAASEALGPLEHAERLRLGTSTSRTLRALDQFEQALELDLALLVEAKEHREPTGWIHVELAECYRATGRWTQARRHFSRALDELAGDPSLSPSERDRIANLATSEDGSVAEGTPP